ncbi:alpha/beta hydrolase [Tepidamorphus sp. 3E244]|uniref:alpha/beta hydrolase n=1 Tax=Tepidamorphus sp. 3E244 TaxID=3385498 RepID=UPI0038FBFE93
MPLDPRAARFLEMAAAGRDVSAIRSVEGRRAGLARLMGFARADTMSPPGEDIVLRHGVHPVPARVYLPTGDELEKLAPTILFLHGGGLVAGSVETHDVIARAICAESRCRLVSLDYRLAPEHPYPAALDDVRAAIGALAADGATLAICGESGGGGLALIVAQEQAGDLAALSLICPVLEFGTETASREEFASGYMIDRETMEADLADYMPSDMVPAHPHISPLRIAHFSALPRTFIHTAECDPLRDEGAALAEKLQHQGVSVAHTLHAGMLHNFHAMGAVLPQGREALKQIGRELGEALGAL